MAENCSKLIIGMLLLVCLFAAQPAMAQKTIAYLRQQGASNYAAQDGNITKILGSAGITIGTATIPGLGYRINEYEQNSEPDPITTAEADLIFVSETIASGNIKYHTDDPVPIVMCEQALYDDDAPPRSEMYFSGGAGSLASGVAFDFDITNNTHPITSIFPLGRVRMFNTGELGYMSPPMAAAVTTLACDPTNNTRPCLAVADQGATGFRPGGTGNDPAPARRICLGFHLNSMSDPTTSGVYLLQRVVQWAMGDPVTAGPVQPPTTPPSAPSGLTATQVVGRAHVLVSWQDNSNNEQGFKLERKTSGTVYVEIAQPGANATSYLDTTVSPGMTYSYHIRAFNSAGDSAFSNEAEVAVFPVLGTLRWHLYIN